MRNHPMRAAAYLVLLLATTGWRATATAAGDSLDEVLVTQVEGLVVVAEDGSVADLKLATDVPGELGPALQQRLRDLRFVPVTVGGQPVKARVAFVLGLAATKKPEGGLSVTVDGIEFFAPADTPTAVADGATPAIIGKMMMPPRIPDDLLRIGVPGGGVDVAVRFGVDGKVEEAAIVRSYMAGRTPGPRGRKLMHEFDAAALAAARKWQAVMPPNASALSPKQRTNTSAITYSLSDGTMPYGRKGVWVAVVRTPKRAVPWLAGDASEADRIGLMGRPGGSTGFQLAAPLAGTPVM